MSVPVRSFRELLHSIARRIGVYNSGSITAGNSGDLTDLINSAYKSAWQFYTWPDALTLSEEALTTHPVATSARYVPRSNATRTMTTVLEVWSSDPRVMNVRAGRVPHQKRQDGLYFDSAAQSPVWVEYRPAAPRFTDTAWSAGTTYAVGDLALASNGHVYQSLQNTNLNKDPLTESSWWLQVPVLECLFEPVKQGVISHYKRYQGGQPVTAKTFEDLMLADLEQEILRLQNQEGQTRSHA